MTALGRHVARLRTGLDEVFSGRWWWLLCRHIAEKRLERMLDQLGENSLVVRHETEHCRRMHFAATYWRSAPGPVRRVILQAKQAGISMSDLRLIVLNTDLRTDGSKVFVRRSVVARILSAAMATVVGVHWFLMYVMTVTAPGPAWLKALVIVGIFCVYASLYRGWSLYAYRSLAAIDRCGKQLEQICMQIDLDGPAKLLSARETRARSGSL